MAIKRGVSFYSYQQEQFFGKMFWKDMIKEVRENLKTDGVEIIDESTIPGYPFPSDQFIYDWNNEMARYGMKAVTMDVYLDVYQFRDHVMTYPEAAERLKNDLKIAARMGFENIRCLNAVPVEVIEMALPTAEKVNVRIGREIHAPSSIKYNPGGTEDYRSRAVRDIVELAAKTKSKHVGLVPDMGIFKHSTSRVVFDYQMRNMDKDISAYILENMGKVPNEEIIETCKSRFNLQEPDDARDWRAAMRYPLAMIRRMLSKENQMTAQPDELMAIVPLIFSIHGKFDEMTEIPGQKGQYHDAAYDYENPIKYLLMAGWDGYMNSEYEGQRHQQDRGMKYLPDSVLEVRRHHEMMARLSGEGTGIVNFDAPTYM